MSVNAERNCTVYILQGREVWSSHQPHELKIANSNLAPASKASIGVSVRISLLPCRRPKRKYGINNVPSIGNELVIVQLAKVE